MLSAEVKKRIEEGLSSSVCLVNEFSGGTDHYSVTIVSDKFEGKTLLARHRMILDLFKAEMETGEVHALTMKLFTPLQWEKEKQQYEKK